jgi:hypothetical protein
VEVPGKSEEEIALEQDQTPAGAEEIVKEEKANPDRVKTPFYPPEIFGGLIRPRWAKAQF